MQHIDGVMIGREVYQNPYMLVEADNAIWQANTAVKSRQMVINEMALNILIITLLMVAEHGM